jgi:hypothetical protein
MQIVKMKRNGSYETRSHSVNRIGFSSLRSEDHPYSCEVLTQRLIAASRLTAFLFIRF